MSDHEFVEEQEKQLLQLIQISFSAPVGRAAFLLKTEEKNFANLTNVIKIPRFDFLDDGSFNLILFGIYKVFDTFLDRL